MPKPLIREVAEFCWSNNFLDVFRQYFVKHGPAFEDAPDMQSGEHNLQYYALFQDYLLVYESTLTTYLESLDVDIVEFYAEVRQAKEETSDPYILTFIDCLLASTDYDSFYKVMVKEGKKCRQARDADASDRKKPASISLSHINIDDRAEAKEMMRTPSSTKAEFTSTSSSGREKKNDYK